MTNPSPSRCCDHHIDTMEEWPCQCKCHTAEKKCDVAVVIPRGILGYTDGKSCAVCGKIHSEKPVQEKNGPHTLSGTSDKRWEEGFKKTFRLDATPEVGEEWEKEFDEQFLKFLERHKDEIDLNKLAVPMTVRDVKAFISKLLQEEREKDDVSLKLRHMADGAKS